jgi:5'-methylthioadenosine phosphorylase
VIGVIGGSGLYTLLDESESVPVATPYGDPSAPVAVGVVDGATVAFLPRHGLDHEVPPHRVNYRANLWALQSLGVTTVVAPFAAGSLRPELVPGDVVVVDQLIDRTNGRKSTFFDGPEVRHVSFADPYCPAASAVLLATARDLRLGVHARGSRAAPSRVGIAPWAPTW